MPATRKPPDTSNELLVYRFGNGVKLIRPEEADKYKHYHLAHQTGYRVDDLLKMPLNFYFLNSQGATEKMSEAGAIICGYQSMYDSVGKSLFDVAKRESASHLINNCNIVMNENMIKIFDETNTRKDNVAVQFLSVKAPWYDARNQIIGTYGCSIALGMHPLASSLTLLRKMGLLDADNNVSQLNQFSYDVKVNEVHLTKREIECLSYITKGYTAKQIAQVLGISYRTVEEYIANIKEKTGATSKAQLIEIGVNALTAV
jgi:DNA-binding CsgD family transcriptional regulator